MGRRGAGKVGEVACVSSGVKANPAPSPRVFPELQHFYSNQSRLPDSRVVLCFGEEFPDMTPLRSKLILVQVRTGSFGACGQISWPERQDPVCPRAVEQRARNGVLCLCAEADLSETFKGQKWTLATSELSSHVLVLSWSVCPPDLHPPFLVWFVFQNQNLLSRKIPSCIKV